MSFNIKFTTVYIFEYNTILIKHDPDITKNLIT